MSTRPLPGLAAAWGLGAASLLCGCASTCAPCSPCRAECGAAVASRDERPADRSTVDKWMAAARAHGSGRAAIYKFLAATYDADRDGKVTAKEYPRDPKVFARLDENHDGALTAEDFQGATPMEEYLAGFVWQRLAAHAKPPPKEAAGISSEKPPSDDDEGVPDAESLRKAFEFADANKNGLVGEGEIDRALLEAQKTPVPGMVDMPEGVRTFPHLLVAMDADHSGKLSLEEVMVWRSNAEAESKRPPAPTPAKPATPPAPGVATARPPMPKRPEAPAVGKPAPDFTLKSKDGKSSTTLSSFRGKKPVAIVFGSYT